MLSRRDFLGRAAALTVAGLACDAPVSVAAPHKEVQFFGPCPFSEPTAQERWKSLSPSFGLKGSGFFGRSRRDVKAILDRTGSSAPAMHVDIGAAQWMELFPYVTDVGSGVPDPPTILSHARSSGVEHFFVEQDLVATPGESLRRGSEFLSRLDLQQ